MGTWENDAATREEEQLHGAHDWRPLALVADLLLSEAPSRLALPQGAQIRHRNLHVDASLRGRWHGCA